jgi:hypothetical protein
MNRFLKTAGNCIRLKCLHQRLSETCTNGHLRLSKTCTNGHLRLSETCTNGHWRLSETCTNGHLRLSETCTNGHLGFQKPVQMVTSSFQELVRDGTSRVFQDNWHHYYSLSWKQIEGEFLILSVTTKWKILTLIGSTGRTDLILQPLKYNIILYLVRLSS